VFELKVKVDEPVPPALSVTLVGLRDALSPEGVADVVRDTGPEKPLRLDKVIVEVWDNPLTTVRLEGAEMTKSVIVTVTVAEWDSDPLVARVDIV